MRRSRSISTSTRLSFYRTVSANTRGQSEEDAVIAGEEANLEDMIRQRYQSACCQYDIFGMAEAVRACMPELMAASPVDVCQMMWGGYYALACAGEIELLRGRPGNAAAYFIDWLRLARRHDDVVFSEIYKYLGVTGACLGEFRWAKDLFQKVSSQLPGDDEIIVYERMIEEAELLGKRTVETLPRHPVRLPHGDGWRDVPIFINSRDRLNCLRQLLSWLLRAGYRNIHILDNASTYAPLLDYYKSIAKIQGIHVVYLPNLGYQALWQSGVLDQLSIETVYVYTDSDVVPRTECPLDIVRRLFLLLRRYPFADKAGPGIIFDDVTFWDRERVKMIHPRFYQVPVGRNVYFAPVDTTFALYRPVRSYRIFSSLRTTGDMMIRHLPWYLDRDHLPEDERYYIEHADSSSTLAASYAKGSDARGTPEMPLTSRADAPPEGK